MGHCPAAAPASTRSPGLVGAGPPRPFVFPVSSNPEVVFVLGNSCVLVAYWRPLDGWRHAFSAYRSPRAGDERSALCGYTGTLAEPSDVDWLDPTCSECRRQTRILAQARRKMGA